MPSEKQAKALHRALGRAPLSLVYLLKHRTPKPDLSVTLSTLEQYFQYNNIKIYWLGRCVHPLNRSDFDWDDALVINLPDLSSYRYLENNPAYRSWLANLAGVEVHTCQSTAVSRFMVKVLQHVIPIFAPQEVYSSRDITEECISDIDPTKEAIEAISESPLPGPICILNFHKYREVGAYPDNVPESGRPVSGARAYMRYGRAALRTVIGRRNRLLLIGGYGFCFIGNGGDPQYKFYDEVTLMQYHSRAEFINSFRLKVMDDRIRHRRAGLEHCVMVATEPFVRFAAV